MSDDVMPLYDRAKHQIYDDYQRLKRQSSIYLTSKKSLKKYALKHFKTKFLNYYNEVYIQKGYLSFEKTFRDKLDEYFNNISLIKDEEDIMQIMAMCMQLMKHLNITNIQFERDSFGIR